VVGLQIGKYKDQAILALDNVLRLEVMPIYTQNTELFKSERRRWLIMYRDAHPSLLRQTYDGRSWVDMFDRYGDELVVIAEVRAYFEIAHKVHTNCQISLYPFTHVIE